jgi:hypothetical protein
VHGETVQLDVPEAGAGGGTSEPVFQFASANGSRVFFTDTQQLTTASASNQTVANGLGDLYECLIVEGGGGNLECKLTDLTPVNKGEPARVLGVLGASQDATWVYFVANGRQGEDAHTVQGHCEMKQGSLADVCDLYVRHFDGSGWEAARPVAVLSDDDDRDWVTAPHFSRVSGNGEWLVFMSRADLTGYDNRDAASGEPDQEVYLYDATTGALVCASCSPTGARPVGRDFNGNTYNSALVDRGLLNGVWTAGSLPPLEESYGPGGYLYQPRYLSNTGRLFFDSNDALVSQDVNGTEDVYEYEPQGEGSEGARCGPGSESGSVAFKPEHIFKSEDGEGVEPAGCVGLISSGNSPEESAVIDASESGDDVFFMTAAKLSLRDVDTAVDVYDAHACTVQSPCVSPVTSPPECVTADACRAAPTPQPGVFGPPPSATFSGPGNLAPLPPLPVVKRATKTTVRCPRGKALDKRNKCVRATKSGKKVNRKGRK